MKFGICLQTTIPVRNEPTEVAELNTQLLFGEIYTLLDVREKWVCIKNENDNQEGWIDRKLAVVIDEKQKEEFILSDKIILNKPLVFVKKNNDKMPLVAGSIFYKNNNNNFYIDNTNYCLTDSYNKLSLTDVAKQFLNTPYLWGGKNMLGIDCSGFTQVVYKTKGIQLPRNASQQVRVGKTIDFIEQTKAGDLAFFDNDEGDIIHVGILLDSKTIIHSSGWVRIDAIDHQGIYNSETQKYSHRLRIIKRI